MLLGSLWMASYDPCQNCQIYPAAFTFYPAIRSCNSPSEKSFQLLPNPNFLENRRTGKMELTLDFVNREMA